MRGSRKDIPVSVDLPEIKLRQVDWDGMTVELGNARKTVDPHRFSRVYPMIVANARIGGM